MNTLQILESFAHVATAVGMLLAAYQLRLTRSQAQTSFEDSMSKEYRDLASQIPPKAFLGKDLEEALRDGKQDEFYHYFDLCNEQVFLRQNHRVRTKTWIFWVDGIKSNLELPAFKQEWKTITDQAPGYFDELRLLIECDYKIDPAGRKWRKRIGKEKQTPCLALNAAREITASAAPGPTL